MERGHFVTLTCEEGSAETQSAATTEGMLARFSVGLTRDGMGLVE